MKSAGYGLLALGLASLILAFATLLQQRDGATALIAGVALLVVGAVLQFVASHAPKGTAGHSDAADQPREVLGGRRGYIAIGVSIAFCLGITVYVLTAGLDGRILFLLWIVIGGFAAIFIARRLTGTGKDGDRS